MNKILIILVIVCISVSILAQTGSNSDYNNAIENVEFEYDNDDDQLNIARENYQLLNRVPLIITYPIGFLLVFTMYFLFLHTSFEKLLAKGSNPIIASAKCFSNWLISSYIILLVVLSDFLNWDYPHFFEYLKIKLIVILPLSIVFIVIFLVTEQVKSTVRSQ